MIKESSSKQVHMYKSPKHKKVKTKQKPKTKNSTLLLDSTSPAHQAKTISKSITLHYDSSSRYKEPISPSL